MHELIRAVRGPSKRQYLEFLLSDAEYRLYFRCLPPMMVLAPSSNWTLVQSFAMRQYRRFSSCTAHDVYCQDEASTTRMICGHRCHALD